MATIQNQILMFWLDANNKPATTFWVTQDQDAGAASSYAALAGAAQNLSYASVIAIQFQQTLVLANAATTGPYQSVLDRGVLLTKLEGLNGGVRYGIPAPRQEIFLPGNVVIDTSNADVMALLTELQSTCGDGNGHNVSYFKRGWRARAGGDR